MKKIRSPKNADGSYVEFDPETGKFEMKESIFTWISAWAMFLFLWLVFANAIFGGYSGTRMPWG